MASLLTPRKSRNGVVGVFAFARVRIEFPGPRVLSNRLEGLASEGTQDEEVQLNAHFS